MLADACRNDVHTVSCSLAISSRFYQNSEAFASELLENIKEMFPPYHMKVQMFDDTIACFPSSRCVFSCMNYSTQMLTCTVTLKMSSSF